MMMMMMMMMNFHDQQVLSQRLSTLHLTTFILKRVERGKELKEGLITHKGDVAAWLVKCWLTARIHMVDTRYKMIILSFHA